MSLLSDEVFDENELNKVNGEEGGGTRAHDDSPLGTYKHESPLGDYKSQGSSSKKRKVSQ